MVISSSEDYRKAAQKVLPPFLFHYIDGGANNEYTLTQNTSDLGNIEIKQRVLRDVENVDITTRLFDEQLTMPVVLAPVGLTGMYARRGEVQAAKAAAQKGIPFTLSSVSVCPIEEVAPTIDRAMWLQLYMLKDHGFMRNLLERAKLHGISKLVFTVDMPAPGVRYRDGRFGMSGSNVTLRRILQAMGKPRWAWDVGIRGKPHDLGNISKYFGSPIDFESYISWNFDPKITWKDLEWIRQAWDGQLILKGILNEEDAINSVECGADGIIVSNHGGRQLGTTCSTASILPRIADKVKGKTVLLADSGIRSGVDVIRMLALGADGVMIGRSYAYALSYGGQAAVEHLLTLFEHEMKVTMMLAGINSIQEVTSDILVE